MDAHSVVDDWDTVPFDGGFAELAELAERGFSGAIEADGTWLFFRVGEALAVVSDLETTPRPGDIARFEDAVGTQHTAPNPSVATLAAMLALDGDVRGRYYTDDTPLEAVDETLSGGGFTGYVELSENVLSGDYYFVYVGGEVEHIGFVGSSQLFTGEEAETKANGEIGIYAVTAVSLPRPELPEPPEPEGHETPSVGSQPPTGSSETESNATADANGPDSSQSTTDPGESGSQPTSAPTSDPEAEATSDPDRPGSGPDSPSESPSAEPDAQAGPSATERPDGTVEPDPGDGSDESPSVPDAPAGDRSDVTDSGAVSEATDDEPTSASDPADSSEAATAEASSDSEHRYSTGGGIEAVTTRTVPSLDPENSGRVPSGTPSRETPSKATPGRQSDSDRRAVRDSSQGAIQSRTDEQTKQLREEYESEIEARESKIETYESKVADLESELGESEDRIEELEAELDSLRDERDELRGQLGSADTTRGMSLSAADALSKTSLFVRAIDRGEATLESAHAGDVNREAVNENLRIEYHTEFEDGDATVEGEPFEAWLRSSDAHAFVEWLVTDLFFEIRSTGATEGLRPLYDSLPEIDRIGFEETIRVGDGTEGRETGFDIVARNKKGNPVVVVTFDRQRDPTRADSIEPFVTDASDVCEEYESLAGAVAITSSYFESDARAAVEEATSTSLLSRSKHRSYVKLSRTAGYHLCLVEFRDGSFNLTHPEL